MGHSNRYNNIVVLFVALGSFTYGFNSSIVASFTGLPSFNDYFDFTTRETYAQNMLGAMNALYAAGGLIGCGIVGWMADKLGRTISIQIICACCLVASIITTASVNIGMLLLGRTLQGISSGMVDVIVPLYQSEVSPMEIRGRMVGSHACLLVCGYAGASWVGLGCYFETNPQVQWRLCIALQMVAPLLLALGSPWIPESPRWLIYNGREEESRAILQKLHMRTDDESNIVATEEFTQIVQQVALDRANEMSFFALWRQELTRKRLVLGFFVIFAAQSSGVLVINNYQIVLYQGLGINGWRALLLLAVYTSWAAFMNFVNAALLDRFGRIKLMCLGLTGAACAVGCEAAIVARFGGSDNAVGNAFGVLFLFVFITFFAGGMDASCYVYLSELYPTWMRAQGVAFSVMGLFSATLIYTGAASDAFASIGWKYYLVFITVPLACVAIIWFYLPETNGLSLEEIGKFFGDEVALDLGQMTPETRENFDKSLIEGKKVSSLDSSSGNIDSKDKGNS